MKKLILPLSVALMLGACSSSKPDKPALEGDRLSLYDFEKTLQKSPNTQFGFDGTENGLVVGLPDSIKGGPDRAAALIAPWDNKFWPQVGGYANHAMKHVAFTEFEPSRLWKSDIGKGATKRMPLTAAPIMADGKVFTLNNDAEITAVDADTGKELWTTSIIKKGEDEVVIGGGLAFSAGRLFATNGFNEILSLDANTGEIWWRSQTKAPVRAAPATLPNRVFVTTMDNETIALNALDGTQIWSHRGLDGEAGVLGAATPALTRDAVITAYSSGEIYALQIETGAPLWSENLAPLARAAGSTGLSDIRALPVADSNFVYAASVSNRMSAIDARSGQQVWQVPLGTASTPWVSGNRIFMIATEGSLVSINRQDGSILWQTQLPRYKDAEDRDGIILWQGPYLAGERLLAFGSNGMARSYNVVTGDFIREWKIGHDVQLPAAFADKTLYLLGNDGYLTAWK